MKKLLLFILIAMLVVPSFAQRRKKTDDEQAPVYVEGITYALPRTGIRIHVKAVKEEFTPGPYAAYASQLLGIENARTGNAVKWTIADVKMETFSEPDPKHVYKAMGEAAFLVSLTPGGCLAGINVSEISVDRTQPVTNVFVSAPKQDDGFLFANVNDSPLYTPGDSTNNFRPVRASAEQKAAEAAKRILEARKNQYHIAAGLLDEFHPDGEAYDVSLQELKEIENRYLSLFTGRTQYESQNFSFDYIPGAASEKGEVVFRISDQNGVVPVSDLSGKPVMLKVTPVEDLAKQYWERVNSENPAAGESGVYYRMPGVGDLELLYELKPIASMRAVLPQLGVVAPLPEDLLFGEYAIEIHPETGAVKSVRKK